MTLRSSRADELRTLAACVYPKVPPGLARTEVTATHPTVVHERLAALSRRWGVSVDRVLETPGSLIGFGAQGSRRVVLKVVARPHEEWNAGGVVAAFSGCGMVTAIEHLPGAVLLEEVRPGTPLVTWVRADRDGEADRVLAKVIAWMGETDPETRGHPRAEDWAVSFDRYIESDVRAVPRDLSISARDVFRELCRTQRSRRLLHGDLQHYNVLLDRKRGWLAIDPKGVVAEAEYELGAVLRSPPDRPDLLTRPGIERRVEGLSGDLGLDARRVIGWTFAQAVLSAIWMIEDGSDVPQDAPAMRVARAARELLGC